jgi:hypothetical protein
MGVSPSDVTRSPFIVGGVAETDGGVLTTTSAMLWVVVVSGTLHVSL